MDSAKKPNELLTPQEVAEWLKVSIKTVFRHFASREGVIDLGTAEDVRRKRRRRRILRIPRWVVEKYLMERTAS